jgi:hypothetical protein
VNVEHPLDRLDLTRGAMQSLADIVDDFTGQLHGLSPRASGLMTSENRDLWKDHHSLSRPGCLYSAASVRDVE